LVGQAGFVVESVHGAIYYPRWAPAARWASRYDSLLSRHTMFGAGFMALAATKPSGR
jgi:hypothetical protein